MYNFTIDQNADTVINVPAAGAAAGQMIMVKFFDTAINIFNIATSELGGTSGDIVINDGVDYEFTVTDEQALKAVPTNTITYELYLLSAFGSAGTLINSGTITVTPLTGADVLTLIPWSNSDRILRQAGALTFTSDHDNVILTPATAVECILPDARKMPGKRFRVKMIGAGSALIKTPDDATLINMDTTGDSCLILAVGTSDADDWVVFFG